MAEDDRGDALADEDCGGPPGSIREPAPCRSLPAAGQHAKSRAEVTAGGEATATTLVTQVTAAAAEADVEAATQTERTMPVDAATQTERTMPVEAATRTECSKSVEAATRTECSKSVEAATHVDADAAMFGAALALTAANPEMLRVREVAFAALRLQPGQRVLDAGAGIGEVARLIAARLGGLGEVVAVDQSDATIAAARERHDGSSVQYRRGDVTALDFPDGHFDAVRCERVLQHLTEPDAAVAELARVTRPGGRVCLVDTDWESVAVDGLPEHLVTAVRRHLLATVLRRHLDMGRTLRRRLLRAGLCEVTAVPVALYFADPIAAATVLPMVNPMVPPEARLIPPELREDWFGALSEAGERGDFLATITMWVATATR